MLSRFRISIAFSLFLAFLFTVPTLAGGWAVITLDELPTNVVAGEPYTIGFTVLQHGRTPMTDIAPTITANLYKEEEFTVRARPEGDPGHYTASVTFPKEGQWSWSVQAFTMDQPMPMLVVAPATANAPGMTGASRSLQTLPIVFSGLAFAAAIAGMLIAFRRKSRPAWILTVFCFSAGIVLAVVAAGKVSGVEAQAKSNASGSGSSVSEVEFGKQLFIAKGCITCHYNSKAETSEDYLTVEMGAPNLSKFSAVPEVLRMRLKDPSSVKSDTNMPKLTLSDAEIEALIAFINSK